MGSNKTKFYVDIMAFNSEVTGSCHLVNVRFPSGEWVKFLVDCGMYQEKETEELNSKFEFDPSKVDFVIATHNHIDHTGRLPCLFKNGYSGEIYTTLDNAEYLIKRSLEDSTAVINENARLRGIRPMYDEAHLDMTLRALKGYAFKETFRPHKDVMVTFFKNGHVVGAALVLVQIKYPGCKYINLLFTGDYNDKNMFFDVPKLPKHLLDMPITVIQESTYGTTEFAPEPRFMDTIEAKINEKQTVVLLAYSFGRTQDVLYRLRQMQENGKLDPNIPIFLDGKLGIDYTKIYQLLNIRENMKDFLPSNFQFVDKTMRNDIASQPGKKIIVTSSGNGSYGPAQFYLPLFLGREDTYIAFTGYTPANTLGAAMVDVEYNEYVKVGGLVVPKRAEVDYFTEFSSHAKAGALIDFLKNFNNLNLVLVNHGESQTKLAYANMVEERVKTKVVGILDRDYFFRVDAYGLVRSIPSKFL